MVFRFFGLSLQSMKKTVFLLSLILLAVAAPAAPSGYSFRRYSSRDGLASNTVRAIIQDHRGLIWLGTGNGLDSFDGREIIHHRIPEGESVAVQSLFEDSSLTLWVGTDEAVFNLASGEPERIGGIPEASVTSFAEDREGNLWIGTWGEGLFRLKDGSATAFLEGHQIEGIHLSRDGRLWVADSSVEEGLLLYNAATRSFISPGLLFQDCAPARVCAIAEDVDGDLWLGTWNSGLYRVDADRTVHLAIPPGNGLNHIHSVTHMGAWHFLVGSDDGLLEANLLTGERTLYRNDRKDPASLSDKFVYPVARDHEGGMWVGTYYGGVNYVSPNNDQFSFRSLAGLVDADEDYIVSCFCEDPDGTVWIGSDNGGLFRYDPVRNAAWRWTASPGWTQRLASFNIHALLRDGDDLWIGTYSENIVRLNVKTGKVRVYGWDQGLDASSAYALCIGPDGALWAGSTSGICRYDTATDRFTREREVGDWILDIQSDSGGNLWFGTSRNGVLRRSPDGSWQTFDFSGDGLPSNYVNCLHSTPHGIYVGTQKGIALISEDGVRTLQDKEDVRRIAFDGNQLWYSTNTDVVRFPLPGGEPERFDAGDGVSASMFSPNAGLTARDGTVYLGAADGFVSFFPGKIQGNGIPPSVLFTRFHAAGPGESMDVLQTFGDERIVLPWRLRDVRVTFAALSYCAPENNRYAYRLEGLESHWKDIGNENSLTLNQLPSGHYRLQVIASNNSGVWNTEGASLSFVVRPHPLLSGVALTLYTLLLGTVLFLLGRWLQRRTERKSQARYERELNAAVSLVKEEERGDRYQFISSLADQLEAPVAGIGAQLEKLKEASRTAPAVKGGVSVIEKNQRMLRSITSNLQQMRATLALSEGQDTPEAAGREEDFLQRLDRLITENIANPDLSVSFLAQELAISRSGLFAKARELCGETPNKLINQARLNAAAKLLSEGGHSIGEICYMTGFSSPSYFSKSFTAQFGFTPHEWAQMQKE